MNARAAILARLQAAPVAAQPLPDVAAYYRAHRRAETPRARIARFTEAMLAAHAEVHRTDALSWPALLGGLMARKQLPNLLVGAGAADAATLAAQGQTGFDVLRYETSGAAFRQTLFNGVAAGLSRARSAIAETGTLVLWPDAHEPRLLSLVPPVHFVLLNASALHADLHGAVTAEGWALGMPTNAVLISGPSKTADIQQVLAYGAHGPRELIVLLCDDLDDGFGDGFADDTGASA
jgi:L-lactate dehydrogenase complex protein LldG